MPFRNFINLMAYNQSVPQLWALNSGRISVSINGSVDTSTLNWCPTCALCNEYIVMVDSFYLDRTTEVNSIPTCTCVGSLNENDLLNVLNRLALKTNQGPFATIQAAMTFALNEGMFVTNQSYPYIPTLNNELFLDAGLPASYPLAGNQWIDMTGNQNNGTLVNGVTHDLSLKGSLIFNGTNQYASFSSPVDIPVANSNYTINVWFNADTLGNRGIIGWGNYSTTNQSNYIKLTNTGISNSWTNNDLSFTTAIPTGQWQNVIATYDGTTRKLWLNGVLVAQDNPVGHNVTNANNLTVGLANTNEYFDGNISLVQVFNRAITGQEVQDSFLNFKTRYDGTDTEICITPTYCTPSPTKTPPPTPTNTRTPTPTPTYTPTNTNTPSQTPTSPKGECWMVTELYGNYSYVSYIDRFGNQACETVGPYDSVTLCIFPNTENAIQGYEEPLCTGNGVDYNEQDLMSDCYGDCTYYGDICVLDAGTEIANGTYSYVGTIYGKLRYSNGTCIIEWTGTSWVIKQPLGPISILLYSSTDDVQYPYEVDNWTAESGGSLPVPTVVVGVCPTPTSTPEPTSTPTVTPTKDCVGCSETKSGSYTGLDFYTYPNTYLCDIGEVTNICYTAIDSASPGSGQIDTNNGSYGTTTTTIYASNSNSTNTINYASTYLALQVGDELKVTVGVVNYFFSVTSITNSGSFQTIGVLFISATGGNQTPSFGGSVCLYFETNETINSEISWAEIDRPNRFAIYNSLGQVANTGWVGFANYSGPWGASLNNPGPGSLNFIYNPIYKPYYVVVDAGPADPSNPITDFYNYTVVCDVPITQTPSQTSPPVTPTPTSTPPKYTLTIYASLEDIPTVPVGSYPTETAARIYLTTLAPVVGNTLLGGNIRSTSCNYLYTITNITPGSTIPLGMLGWSSNRPIEFDVFDGNLCSGTKLTFGCGTALDHGGGVSITVNSNMIISMVAKVSSKAGGGKSFTYCLPV